MRSFNFAVPNPPPYCLKRSLPECDRFIWTLFSLRIFKAVFLARTPLPVSAFHRSCVRTKNFASRKTTLSGDSVLKAICDAGPLIHLAEIKQTLLLTQFSPLVIPEKVLAEAISFKPPSGLRFEVHTPSQADRLNVRERLLPQLEPGETDAIALSLKSPDAIFLCDDLKARREAERLGISVHGSLGIVVRAFRLGLLTREQAKAVLADLGNCRTLFISKAIVERALHQLDVST